MVYGLRLGAGNLLFAHSKNVASTAVYGMRGAGGVIIITTRR